MPKLRQKKADFDALGRLLRGYGVNGASLSDAIGCAPVTARKKLAEPKYLTVGDLYRASEKFGIPMDEIRHSIVR